MEIRTNITERDNEKIITDLIDETTADFCADNWLSFKMREMFRDTLYQNIYPNDIKKILTGEMETGDFIAEITDDADALIYNNSLWEIMREYQNPHNANFEKAVDLFIGDLTYILNKICEAWGNYEK